MTEHKCVKCDKEFKRKGALDMHNSYTIAHSLEHPFGYCYREMIGSIYPAFELPG